MRRSTLNALTGILFLVLTVVFIFLTWNSAKIQNSSQTESNILERAADISSLKTQAEKLVSEKENNAGLPIPVPTEKLNKTNPFASAE